MKNAENIEIFTTEDGRDEAVDVIRNFIMLSARVKNLISDACSSNKRLYKDKFFEELGCTYLISRWNLKEAGKHDWGLEMQCSMKKIGKY